MLLALRGVRTATQRSLRGGTAAAPTYAAAAVALPLLRQRMLSTSQARLARPVDKAAPKQDEAAAGNEASAEEASPSDAATAGKAERPTPAKKSATSAFDIDTSLSIASLPDPAKEGQAGAQRTGARARKNSTSTSQERQSKKMLTYLFGAGFIAAAGWTFGSLGAEWETIEERERYANDPSAQGYFGRIRTRLSLMWQGVNAPAWEKLLPDPLPFPYSRPYTLVLDLDKLLVASKWTRKEAWRTAKRPGLDYFIAYLSNWYEIVLFTRQPFYIAGPIVEKLDPDRRYIAYSLYRESCRTLDNGHVVKDLSHLNRDLKKVIVLDTDPEAVELQPENAILLPKWEGEPKDAELVGLIPFLEAIGIWGIDDVRSTIKAYEGKHIPSEFMKQMRANKEAEEAEWRRKHSKGGKLGFFGNLRGQDPNAGSAGKPPKSWYEQEQERYMQGYLEDQKYWRENGDALRQAAKEDQERQIKEMKLSTWGMLTGQGMKAPEPAA